MHSKLGVAFFQNHVYIYSKFKSFPTFSKPVLFFLDDLLNDLRAMFIPGCCAAIRSAVFWATGIIDNLSQHMEF